MKTNPVMKFGLHPKNCSKGNAKQDTERWEIRSLWPENTEKGCQTVTWYWFCSNQWHLGMKENIPDLHQDNQEEFGLIHKDCQDSIRIMGSNRETDSFHKPGLPLSHPQYQEPANQTRLFSGHMFWDFFFCLTSLSDSCSSRPANHQSIRLTGSDESALFSPFFFLSSASLTRSSQPGAGNVVSCVPARSVPPSSLDIDDPWQQRSSARQPVSGAPTRLAAPDGQHVPRVSPSRPHPHQFTACLPSPWYSCVPPSPFRSAVLNYHAPFR